MSLDFLNGLISLPWWGYVVVALVVTQITIAGVTLFLHRCQAHRGLELHPIISHFFRFWLWLTTGMVTKEWVAIHRKHHAFCETKDDPHSPMVYGIRKVLLEGAELYRSEAKNQETLDKYGKGTPDDWIERNVYSKYSWQGSGLMLVTNVVLFGPIGATIWAIQMAWIPVHAAGIINGAGHFWGYRHFMVNDTSTNLTPIAMWIGGEELHNNHHAFPTSARFSMRWYEFDIGWMYIRIMQFLGLATVKKVAPRPKFDMNKAACDVETVQAVIAHRYEIATRYARSLKQTCAEEIRKLRENGQAPSLTQLRDAKAVRRFRQWLASDASSMPQEQREALDQTLAESRVLNTIYAFRQELDQLWQRSTMTSDQMVKQLEDWCQRAEASGIAALAQFSRGLRAYAA